MLGRGLANDPFGWGMGLGLRLRLSLGKGATKFKIVREIVGHGVLGGTGKIRI